ncbi:type II toxin-antitoxin system PemK/MazF family toxin [Lacticaseibacillus manihotivorans]|uniref:type II toxin-antitoxin system PemK/MazF family toxin n=1 Tax=Lacticaseibacillus manihotivorans TaxID=88233 RepID=UPI000AB481C9|nr:type II toxin-antitoxin system PemK/MazF family toxin [Lacticaseibacillus manihotivorans]
MQMPKQGDIIFIDSEPHAGKEFGGHDPEQNNTRRPMIVLSNTDYNHGTKMVIGMLVTHSNFGDSSWYEQFADFNSGVEGNIVLCSCQPMMLWRVALKLWDMFRTSC